MTGALRRGCHERTLGDAGIHRLDLDDEVTKTAAVVAVGLGWIVDEFDGDEVVVGEFEHGQLAYWRLGNPTDDLVAEGRGEL